MKYFVLSFTCMLFMFNHSKGQNKHIDSIAAYYQNIRLKKLKKKYEKLIMDQNYAFAKTIHKKIYLENTKDLSFIPIENFKLSKELKERDLKTIKFENYLIINKNYNPNKIIVLKKNRFYGYISISSYGVGIQHKRSVYNCVGNSRKIYNKLTKYNPTVLFTMQGFGDDWFLIRNDQVYFFSFEDYKLYDFDSYIKSSRTKKDILGILKLQHNKEYRDSIIESHYKKYDIFYKTK